MFCNRYRWMNWPKNKSSNYSQFVNCHRTTLSSIFRDMHILLSKLIHLRNLGNRFDWTCHGVGDPHWGLGRIQGKSHFAAKLDFQLEKCVWSTCSSSQSGSKFKGHFDLLRPQNRMNKFFRYNFFIDLILGMKEAEMIHLRPPPPPKLLPNCHEEQVGHIKFSDWKSSLVSKCDFSKIHRRGIFQALNAHLNAHFMFE